MRHCVKLIIKLKKINKYIKTDYLINNRVKTNTQKYLKF